MTAPDAKAALAPVAAGQGGGGLSIARADLHAATPGACAIDPAAKEVRLTAGRARPRGLAVSPDGRLAAIACCFRDTAESWDGEVRIDVFELAAGNQVPTLVRQIHLPDGGGVYRSTLDKSLRGRFRQILFLGPTTLALSVDGRLRRFDALSGATIGETIFGDHLEAACVHGDLLAVSVFPAQAEGRPTCFLDAPGVRVLRMTPDGRTALVRSLEFRTLPKDMAFSASGQELIGLYSRGLAPFQEGAAVAFLSGETRVLGEGEVKEQIGSVSNVLPDGRFAIANDHSVRLFDGSFVERARYDRGRPGASMVNQALVGDGRWLYETTASSIERWDLAAARPAPRPVALEIGSIGEIACVPGRSDRLLAMVEEGPHYRLVVLDADTARPVGSCQRGIVQTVEPRGIDVERSGGLCVASGVEALRLGDDLAIKGRIEPRTGRIFQLWRRPDDGDLFVGAYDWNCGWWDGERLRAHVGKDGVTARRWKGFSMAVPMGAGDYYLSEGPRANVRLSPGSDCLWVCQGQGTLYLWRCAGRWSVDEHVLLSDGVEMVAPDGKTITVTAGAVVWNRFLLLADTERRIRAVDPRPSEASPSRAGTKLHLAPSAARLLLTADQDIQGMFTLDPETVLFWTADRLHRLRFEGAGGQLPAVAARDILDEPGVRGINRLGDGRLVMSFDHHHSFRTPDLVERWRMYLVEGRPLYFVPSRPGVATKGDRLDGLLWYEGGPAALPPGVLRVTDARGEPVTGARATAYLETVFDQRLVAKVVAGDHAGVAEVVSRAAARQTLAISAPRALSSVAVS